MDLTMRPGVVQVIHLIGSVGECISSVVAG